MKLLGVLIERASLALGFLVEASKNDTYTSKKPQEVQCTPQEHIGNPLNRKVSSGREVLCRKLETRYVHFRDLHCEFQRKLVDTNWSCNLSGFVGTGFLGRNLEKRYVHL